MHQKFVTTVQMKELDRLAIEQHGIPAAVLMENAGKAVAFEAMRFQGKAAAAFCGYGNNGGDGFVAARYLIEKGYDVNVLLAGKEKKFKSEAKDNYDRLVKSGCIPRKFSDINQLNLCLENIKVPDIIIDAIFGIGIKGRLDDFYTALIEAINALKVPVVSIDVPSGLDADTGEPLGTAVKAAKTVTLGYPKVGFKNPNAKIYLGEVVVADIGLPKRND